MRPGVVRSPDWELHYAGGKFRSDPDTDPLLDEFRDIDSLETVFGIGSDTPVISDGEGSIDLGLIDYFTSMTWRGLSKKSKRTYAPLLKNFFQFLDLQRHKGPFEADSEDIGLWKTLRTDFSVNPEGAVALVSWGKERAALDGFYTWASYPSRALCPYNPMSGVPADRVSTKSGKRPATQDERDAFGVRWMASDRRAYRGKWLSPATYLGWRDVGLRGYLLAPGASPGKYIVAAPDAAYRGRNQQRNVAWCDLAYLTGMRLSEQSFLLTLELPPQMTSEVHDFVLGGGITKYHKTRRVVEPPTASMTVWEYLVGERQEAVHSARRRGVYDRDDWIRVIATSHQRGTLMLQYGGSGFRSVEDLPADVRLRLLYEGPDGWEPMALWLSERGQPMSSGAWSTVLERASDRYMAETQRVGAAGMTVSPHCLRFSFALLYLIALHQRIDAADPVPSGTPYDPRRYDRAYRRVQAQLGHADLLTTKETYLEALVDLRDADLLSGAAGDIGRTIEALAQRSALIRADIE